MARNPRSTVVGVFMHRTEADRAITDLRQAGFTNEQIGLAGRHIAENEAVEMEEGTEWETGAVTGVLAGAGLGGLVGLGIMAGLIPAIGPVIAGGTLAAILANAAGGAALGGLAGALVGAGIPEEEAKYYQSEFEAGRYVVTVKANGRADEALAILRRHGAHDIHSADATGRASAMTATAAEARTAAAMASPTGAAGATGVEGGQTFQVREEELHARKTPVETGEVRVRKEVVTEQKTMEFPVRREEIVVERHAATGQHGTTGEIREGEEMRIPVMEEQVSVTKTPVVKEEVTVGKRVVQDTERVTGEVRKEKVRVEREGDVDVTGCDPGTKPR